MNFLWLSMINSSGIRCSWPSTYLKECFLDFCCSILPPRIHSQLCWIQSQVAPSNAPIPGHWWWHRGREWWWRWPETVVCFVRSWAAVPQWQANYCPSAISSRYKPTVLSGSARWVNMSRSDFDTATFCQHKKCISLSKCLPEKQTFTCHLGWQ